MTKSGQNKAKARHFNITVHGRVQGVGFRYSTLDEAINLGLKGFVCNQPDGGVYIEAEGDASALIAFVEWCKHGPATAHVDNVAVSEDAFVNFTEFKIHKSGSYR